jgi:F420-non-reducing hydrogenase iron-sulfur subunit
MQERASMTTSVAIEPRTPAAGGVPRILVFSTNTISDPGVDLAGSAHLHYSPGVNVISLPCTSGIRPSWIVHAFDEGFAGVFVATDGEECAYLPDCAKRSNKIVQTAQKTLKERGIDPSRIRVAAICSVCAEPFTKHMTTFSAALVAMGPAKAEGSR